MSGITRRSGVARAVASLAAALSVGRAEAQQSGVNPGGPPEDPLDAHLPNGKRQRDEILKAEYSQNLKDARELTELARSFELDLEKSDRFVLSLSLLKKLDDMEKLTKRIRNRMRK